MQRYFFIISLLLVCFFVFVRPTHAASCSDQGCDSVKNGDYYQITNCSVQGDADGDQQLCTARGRIGTCGGNSFCCPSSGASWTRDMSACGTAPTATTTPKPTSKPVHSIIQYIYNQVPALAPYVPPASSVTTDSYVAHSYEVASNAKGGVCNATCSGSDCPSGLNCLSVGNSYRCRVAACRDSSDCSCAVTTPTPTYHLLPTLTPTPHFIHNSTLLYQGIIEPNASVHYVIEPDGISGNTTSDAKGYYRFILPRLLSTGDKKLIATSTTSRGRTVVISEPFRISSYMYPTTLFNYSFSPGARLDFGDYR